MIELALLVSRKEESMGMPLITAVLVVTIIFHRIAVDRVELTAQAQMATVTSGVRQPCPTQAMAHTTIN
jgi:hypothetical protein